MPDLATLAPLLILLAVFVTAAKAFLELLIVPFLPYEVEAFTAFIPALTALLKLVLRLTGFILGIGAPNGRINGLSSKISCVKPIGLLAKSRLRAAIGALMS